MGRSAILAALGNAIAILIGVGAVALEAFERFSTPVEPLALPTLIIFAIGIAINTGTVLLFQKDGRTISMQRCLPAHGSRHRGIGGRRDRSGGLLATGWLWLDPLVATLVSLFFA
ncbi:hypothetical protein HHL08_09430 [Sphingobium sp. AR-3-1]|uniref:Cation efflux protein transmembrane domain-containing protein n=1 Tax=Sphingobium psychrophilum TaxID=2728834 RepID=A0A7X9WUZ8_9SPHN|nr:hypothetical protein [Sphingobium psychrophilum]